jgi:hypothetical protein
MAVTAETTDCYRCEIEIRNGEPVSQGCVLVKEVPGNFQDIANQDHGDSLRSLGDVQGTNVLLSEPIKTEFGFEFYMYRPVLK